MSTPASVIAEAGDQVMVPGVLAQKGFLREVVYGPSSHTALAQASPVLDLTRGGRGGQDPPCT